jgi:hypothetical protein
MDPAVPAGETVAFDCDEDSEVDPVCRVRFAALILKLPERGRVPRPRERVSTAAEDRWQYPANDLQVSPPGMPAGTRIFGAAAMRGAPRACQRGRR